MPKPSQQKPCVAVEQPSGWHVQEIVPFLRALASPGDERLASWSGETGTSAPWAGWAREMGLAPYAFYRLRAAAVLGKLPVDAHTLLRSAYYSAAGHAELHTRELADTLDALAAADVTAVLFKGAALAYVAYPDPACRPMGDLDLWLDAEAMPRGRAVLEALGYRTHHKKSRPHALQTNQDGEIQLTGRTPGSGLVELHYGAFAGQWLRRTAVVDRDGIRERIVPVTVAGRRAWTLAPEDAIIQLAVHLAVNHQMAYPGVRGLVDIVLLAQAQPVDWGAVAARARAWRVAATTWLVLGLTDALLGLPAASAAIAGLRPPAIQRWLLRRFANADSLLAGRNITNGPLRFVYQLALVDRPRDAARLLWRALWPENAWLVARYDSAALSVRLRHLLSAARGHV